MSVSTFSSQEWSALYDLYQSLHGEHWKWRGPGKVWNFTDPLANPCVDNWFGIVCNCTQTIDIASVFFDVAEFFHVESPLIQAPPLPVGNCSSHPSTNSSITGIHLGGQNLTGTIPPSIRNFTSLVVLNMSFNSIKGTLPEDIYALSQLEVLYLGLNRLQGNISANISQLKQLQVYNVIANRFGGTIPTQLFELPRLMEIELSVNLIHSELPSHVCNSTSLKYLRINSNHLVGQIPSCLYTSNLLLEQIELHSNYLTGTLSEDLQYLPRLNVLELSDNLMDGTLPKSLAVMNQLQVLGLAYNMFHGELHTVDLMGTGSSIVDFDVGGNAFDGSLPSKYIWPYLRRYYAFSNFLTGSIPAYTLINAPNIHLIDLGTNLLTGSIPKSLDTLPEMYNLLLFENLLSGSIRSMNFANLPHLFALILFNNTLTGRLPDSFGELRSLYCLGLYNNHFTGTFPATFTKVDRVGQILIQNNKFSGPIVNVLGTNTTSLQFIDVSANAFTGTLPSEALAKYNALNSLALASNCLHGDITSFLAQLCAHNKNLQAISLDGLNTGRNCRVPIFGYLSSLFPTKPFATKTNMGGALPSCLFDQMPRLNILHLGGNRLTGSLPGNVNISLNLLDFEASHNQLSQPIPANFLLHTWSNLDLSFNHFNGTLDAMTHLDIDKVTSISQFNQVPSVYMPKLPTWVPSPRDRRNPNIYPGQVAYSNITLALHVNRLSGPIPSPLQGLQNIQILRGNTFSCDQLNKGAQLPRHDPEFSIYSCGSETMSNTMLAMLLVSVIPVLCLQYALYRCWKAKTLQKWLTIRREVDSHDVQVDSDIRNSEFAESQIAVELAASPSFSSARPSASEQLSVSEHNSTATSRTKSKASANFSVVGAFRSQRTISAVAAENQHLWRNYESESATASPSLSEPPVEGGDVSSDIPASSSGHDRRSNTCLAMLCGACFAGYDGVLFVYQQLVHPTVFLEFDVDQHHSGAGAKPNDNVELNVHIASFHYLADNIRIASLYITVFILVVMMTVYSVLHVNFNTHQYSYLWRYSAVWLRGESAAAILTIFFAIFVCLTIYVIRKYIVSYHGSINPNYLYSQQDVKAILQQTVVEESMIRQQSAVSTSAALSSLQADAAAVPQQQPSVAMSEKSAGQASSHSRDSAAAMDASRSHEHASLCSLLSELYKDIWRAGTDLSRWILFYLFDFVLVVIIDILYVYMFLNYDGLKVLIAQFAVSVVKLYWNDNLSVRCFMWYKMQLMRQPVMCYNIQYSIASDTEIADAMQTSTGVTYGRTTSIAFPQSLPTTRPSRGLDMHAGRDSRLTNADQLVDQMDTVRETVSFINHVPYKITINAHEGSIFDPDMQNPFRQSPAVTTNRFTAGAFGSPSSSSRPTSARLTIPDANEDHENASNLATSYCVSIAILPHVDILRLSDVSILNKLVIPCFAVGLISNSCFYDAIVQQTAVTSETYFCFPLPSVGVPCVNIIASYADGTSFVPAFVYSFQCASAFIRYYTPIYIYLMTFSTVVIPSVFCLLRYWYVKYFEADIESYAEYHDLYGHDEHCVTEGSPPQQQAASANSLGSGNRGGSSNIAYPTARGSMYMGSPSLHRPTSVLPKPQKTSTLLKFIHFMLPLEWYAHTLNHFHHLTQRMSNKQQLVIRLTSYIGILISFGALFPLLSVVMCVSIYIVTIMDQRKTHRLLQQSYKLHYPVYSLKLTQECKEFCSSFKQNLRRCVGIAVLFMGYFAFDTLGDSNGWKMGIIPLVLLMFFTAVIQLALRKKIRGLIVNQTKSNSTLNLTEGELLTALGQPVDKEQHRDDVHEVNNPIFASTLIANEVPASSATATMNNNGTASI